MKRRIICSLIAMFVMILPVCADETVYINVASNGIASSDVSADLYGENGISNLFDDNKATYFQSVDGKDTIILDFDNDNYFNRIVITTDIPEQEYWKYNMTSIMLDETSTVYNSVDAKKYGYTGVSEVSDGVYEYTYTFGEKDVAAKRFSFMINDNYGVTESEHMKIYEIELFEDQAKIPQFVTTDITNSIAQTRLITTYTSNGPDNAFDEDETTYFELKDGTNHFTVNFSEGQIVKKVEVISDEPSIYGSNNMNKVGFSNTVNSLIFWESTTSTYVTADSGADLGNGKYKYTYDFSTNTERYKAVGFEAWDFASGGTQLKIYEVKIYADVMSGGELYVPLIEDVAQNATVLQAIADTSYNGNTPSNMIDDNDDTYFEVNNSTLNLVALHLDRSYIVDRVEIISNLPDAEFASYNMSKAGLSNTPGFDCVQQSGAEIAFKNTGEDLGNGTYKYTYNFSVVDGTFNCVGIEPWDWDNVTEPLKIYKFSVFADVNNTDVVYTEAQRRVMSIEAFKAATATTYQSLLQEYADLYSEIGSYYSLLSTATAAKTFVKIRDNVAISNETTLKKCLGYTAFYEAICRLNGTDLSRIANEYIAEYFDISEIYTKLTVDDGVDFISAFETKRTRDYTIEDEEVLEEIVKDLLGELAFSAPMTTKESYVAQMDKYAQLLPDVSEAYKNVENKETLGDFYLQVKDSVTEGTTVEKLITVTQKALLLNALNNGTVEEMVKAINDYQSVVGIESVVNSAATQEVSLVSIANELKIQTFETVSDLNDLGNRMTAIITALATPPSTPTPSPSPIPSPGYSSSFSSSAKITVDKPSATTVMTPVVEEVQLSFVDLENHSWAKTAIANLFEKGIINGKSATVFDPQGMVTREEFTKMIVLAFELNSSEIDLEFNDVDKNAWFYPYVNAAVSNNIITGINKNIFGAGNYLTRQDMAVIAERGLKTKKDGNIKQFTDGTQISTYAQKAVGAMVGAGIMQGYEDNTIRPLNYVTRAEASVFIDKVVKERDK